MKKLIMVFVVLLLIMPTASAYYYNDIRAKGKELGNPENIYDYLWGTTNYHRPVYRISLRDYWEDRTGDCTEVAKATYIMYKAIGLKARISRGYQEGVKHDYTEYWNETQWKWVSVDLNVTREGRGIWK